MRHPMRIGYRSLFAATLMLTALVWWGATNAGQTVHSDVMKTDPVAKLTRATTCTASMYHVTAGENASMAVTNDGGWCWADTYARSNWRTLAATSVAVTHPSRHGHVLVGDIENQEVRVAYRPEPGFAGQDSFTIHYDTDDSENTFLITVSK
jgi:hypothetical protein